MLRALKVVESRPDRETVPIPNLAQKVGRMTWSGGVRLGILGPHAERRGVPMEDAKQIALRALTGAFIDRDPSVVERYFAPDYIQHNPAIPNGQTAIPGLIASLSKDFSYEPGMVVAEGNLVMVHGRYVGWGPKPMVAVDIFRVVNGKLVEHCGVMQEEVPASATAAGNPMFSPVGRR
jgi:predicted SnoaL-like aldol condensation-catalyzing enzyme